MSESPAITDEVVDFSLNIQLSDVPERVRTLAKRSILDGVGLAVAGSVSDAVSVASNIVSAYGELAGESCVLGSSLRLPARFAAFLNGISIHAEDYDDTQLAVRPDRVYGLLTHPTAPVLPAVLAIAERQGASGADLLLAYLVGIEVATKLAEAINPRHYDDGFHSTGTIGTIGAAAGVARLLGLDASQTSACLSIAASQSSGLRESFGTMTKPFHAGHASEGAVLAGELARDSFTAAPSILEAKRGFFQAAGGGFDPTAIHGVLGSPWTFQSPGISIKPHPSGSLTHPGMGAFLDLVVRENLHVDEVRRIAVGTNRHMPNALIHHRPRTALQAKFSMEFCIAILLLDRRAGLAQFTDEIVARTDVQELMERIDFGVAAEAENAGYNNMTTIISVDLVDGRHLETRASFGKGSPQVPMSDDELIEKFVDCMAWGGLSVNAESIAQQVLSLEREEQVDDLLTQCVAS